MTEEKQAAKPARKVPPEKTASKEKTIQVQQLKGEDKDTAAARAFMNPAVGAAITIRQQPSEASKFLSLTPLMQELDKQCKAVQGGSLARGEAMLMAQAHTLDALFNHLAILGAKNLTGNIGHGETLYRLAFKAQSQCRSSIEALAEIKNPRSVAFVKQANIAGGHQQVNNGGEGYPRAGENEIKPNKLLEAQHGERLDTRAAGAASGANPQLEAVGAINGAANKQGKGQGIKKRG